MSEPELIKEKKKSKKRKHTEPTEPGATTTDDNNEISTSTEPTKEKKQKRKHKVMEIVESEQFTYQQGAKVGSDDDDDDLSGLKRTVAISKNKDKKRDKKREKEGKQEEQVVEENKEFASGADDEIDMSALNTKKKKSQTTTTATATTDKKQDTTSLAPSLASRVFLGNLSFKITDDELHTVFDPCGTIQGIHWVTDKTTGKFYGSAFIDFEANEAAVAAVKLNGTEILGRAVRVGFATGAAKSSDIRHNQKQKMGAHIAQAPLMAKPPGCTTVFLGNLPFTITDESLTAAFQHCGEIAQIRWVEKDGEFKGVVLLNLLQLKQQMKL